MANLAHNYRTIRAHLPAGTKFLGVVKANAYGHGAVAVARELERLGAEFMAVATAEEAMELREGGVSVPVLVLGYTPPQFAVYEAEQGIRQEVGDLQQARQLNAALEGSGKQLIIHLKLDTGMSRLGFFAYDRPETIEELTEIASMPNLRIEGVFQHFCAADSLEADALEFTRLQYERFCAMLEQMEQRGIRPAIRHCCKSAAAILHPEYAMDMVRPGIMTYGVSPSADTDGILDLKPMLQLYTTVSQLRDVPAGIDVSYGRTYTTPSDRRLAVLSMGYADGLSRRLSGRTSFLIRGKKAPVAGRICMDLCMVDVTDIPDVQVGDEVTIIGADLPCEHMAQQLDTIAYEILCSINKRIPRIYLQNGKASDILQYSV